MLAINVDAKYDGIKERIDNLTNKIQEAIKDPKQEKVKVKEIEDFNEIMIDTVEEIRGDTAVIWSSLQP